MHAHTCWLSVAPENPYVEAPIANVIVSGGGAFGRRLGLDAVMRIDSLELNYCLCNMIKIPQTFLTMWSNRKKAAISKSKQVLSSTH